ncbi:MAG TPA: 4'-phosphopantetheinyl transferase superfamily protein [Beijerinckiaceae bacterium]|nr:4'-phosphopantetheinyl transferase superfamily protein [Beijerinckiaceae bacterium]
MAVRHRRRPEIDPLALSFDYPGGHADIFVARLEQLARDLSPARAALARRLVARRADCAENDVVLGHDPQGAPLIVAPAAPLHLSLAGRDNIVAAALADDRIGVDVETIAAPFETPRNILHPAEQAVLDAAGEGAPEIFLRFWTAKEAYVKALGEGLAREPSGIEIRLGDDDDFEVWDRGRRIETALAWTGRTLVRRRPVMLACMIAPR